MYMHYCQRSRCIISAKYKIKKFICECISEYLLYLKNCWQLNTSSQSVCISRQMEDISSSRFPKRRLQNLFQNSSASSASTGKLLSSGLIMIWHGSRQGQPLPHCKQHNFFIVILQRQWQLFHCYLQCKFPKPFSIRMHENCSLMTSLRLCFMSPSNVPMPIYLWNLVPELIWRPDKNPGHQNSNRMNFFSLYRKNLKKIPTHLERHFQMIDNRVAQHLLHVWQTSTTDFKLHKSIKQSKVKSEIGLTHFVRPSAS